MTENTESEVNRRFRAKFDFQKYGFYDVTPYIDTLVGFSCKKKLGEKDIKNVSNIGFSISNKTLSDTSSTKKPIYITARYGEELPDGIRLRTKQNFSEPLDLEFRDDFFMCMSTEKIYKKDKEVDANSVLLEVYKKHIKTTQPVRGLLLRIRVRFWKIFLPWILKSLSILSHYLLFLISGDKYTYSLFLQEENLNGQIISSRMEGRVGWRKDSAKINEKEKEAKQIDFFGNKVPQWSIVVYSSFHLFIWFLLKYFGIQTCQIEKFFDNNFLLVSYVIVSFWIFGTVIPVLLKKSVKHFSTLAFNTENSSLKL